MHKLLARQIKRFLGGTEKFPPGLEPFLQAVDGAYEQVDADRRMVEHSLEIASEELLEGRQIGQELHHRKEVEAKLRDALSLLRSTLDSTEDGLFVVANSGQITLFNKVFLKLWGLSDEFVRRGQRSEILAAILPQLKHPENYPARIQEIYGQPLESSFDEIDLKDGRIFERSSIPQVQDGVPVGRVWCFHEVSTRRALEEQLRQSQKMEAVGRLAGGVAHDFNNILTVINGYAELLKSELPIHDPRAAEVEEIHKSGLRAADLTRQLLAFSRRQVLQPKVIDLNQLVADMEKMLRRLIGEDIDFSTILESPLDRVKADHGQIEQVVMNLVVNARDAMSIGGKLTIQTANRKPDPAAAPGSVSAGPCVMIAVTDTGVGMDAETLSHLFEPFFTTKDLGKGTGLGLSTVYGIVKQSGGHISVESAPGTGTTFRVLLPRVSDRATNIRRRSQTGSPTGTETVLLVEDEPPVRTLVETILKSKGYRVLAASNGEEAIRIAAAHPKRIHLLLTDVVMPGMNGIELAKHLGSARPDMQVVLMTGYIEHAASEGALNGSRPFLNKPFTTEGLMFKIREVLDAAAVAGN